MSVFPRACFVDCPYKLSCSLYISSGAFSEIKWGSVQVLKMNESRVKIQPAPQVLIVMLEPALPVPFSLYIRRQLHRKLLLLQDIIQNSSLKVAKKTVTEEVPSSISPHTHTLPNPSSGSWGPHPLSSFLCGMSCKDPAHSWTFDYGLSPWGCYWPPSFIPPGTLLSHFPLSSTYSGNIGNSTWIW